MWFQRQQCTCRACCNNRNSQSFVIRTDPALGDFTTCRVSQRSKRDDNTVRKNFQQQQKGLSRWEPTGSSEKDSTNASTRAESLAANQRSDAQGRCRRRFEPRSDLNALQKKSHKRGSRLGWAPENDARRWDHTRSSPSQECQIWQ
jgi:hypothetical protein